MADPHWLRFSELHWLDGLGGELALAAERILADSLNHDDSADYLKGQLPVVAGETGAQWAAVFARRPQWEVLVEHRRAPDEIPFEMLEEALDRGAAGRAKLDAPADWSLIAVPIPDSRLAGGVLAFAGRHLDEDAFNTAVVVGRALECGLGCVQLQDRDRRAIERLRITLEIASRFATVREYQPLLELIAREATRLLDCDRASIFTWERERKQVVASPALGVEDGTLRLPDDRGIVGEVIQTRKLIRVDDAYGDDRFNQQVDRESGYKTDNLLCIPLKDGGGTLLGAFEAINKQGGPFTADDEESLAQLGVQAANALLAAREREQLIRSRDQLTEQVTNEVRIIGGSPAIVALRDTIARLAATALPVLVMGDSGTGKEVVAQALHYEGPRCDRPFVAVNCAAIAESLLESELFGHEKGAFTDARDVRRGKFELADGGTLFLDEIGDMSLGGQAKLLRVLEQNVVTRVGGSQPLPIDVRIVAATNANLPDRVRQKKFREDLYYRLSVVTQQLPSLADRPEDILPLAEHFMDRFCRQARRQKLVFSAEARRRLQAHGWPGNVRELRNLMERIAFLTPGERDRVEVDDLAFILSPEADSHLEPSPDLGLTEATKEFQKDFIRRAVKRVQGNMSEAARLLGLHRSNLYRKMRQLDMEEVGNEDEA